MFYVQESQFAYFDHLGKMDVIQILIIIHNLSPSKQDVRIKCKDVIFSFDSIVWISNYMSILRS